MHSLLRTFAMQEIRRAQDADAAQTKKDDGDSQPPAAPRRTHGHGGSAAPSSSSSAAAAADTSGFDLGSSAGDSRPAPRLNYHIRLRMMSEELQRTFVQSAMDEETASFIRHAKMRRYVTGFASDLLHATCMSRTSANALTFRGGMFVLSTENAERLLAGAAEATAAQPSSSTSEPLPHYRRWCDIGAGDGGVTARFAHMCGDVFATEASLPMQWRLKLRGYTVPSDIDIAAPYDGVSLFNVLDRCDKPWSLLRDMRRWVKPEGTVVMAVVLPWCPFVESGNKQARPTEELPMLGGRCGERTPFEQCVQTLVDNVVKPAGFEVVRWTRVPYLCEGSAFSQYYALDDVVLVMRRAEEVMTKEAILSVAASLNNPLGGEAPTPAPAAESTMS